MSRLLRRSALVLIPLALGACGPAAKVDDFADRMCGCSDMTCADKVSAEYSAYVKDNPQFKGSKKQEKALTDAITRMLKCRRQIEKPGATVEDLPQ